jgi:hypothetical protein
MMLGMGTRLDYASPAERRTRMARGWLYTLTVLLTVVGINALLLFIAYWRENSAAPIRGALFANVVVLFGGVACTPVVVNKAGAASLIHYLPTTVLCPLGGILLDFLFAWSRIPC